jgi:hypothetical protein
MKEGEYPSQSGLWGPRAEEQAMSEQEFMQRVLSEDVLMPVIIAGGIIIIVAMNTLASVIKTVSRERTRREIAAFIAEGSMTPEQGERLMRVGKDQKC